jgi:endonuclease G, mitochondrial
MSTLVRCFSARPLSLARHAIVLALVGMAPACASRSATTSRPARFPNVAPHAGLTPQQQALIDRNCGPFGQPEKNPDFGFGRTRFVVREGYALEHSSVDKIPIWVCERIEGDQLGGSLARDDAFGPDPQLPQGERAELADYRKSGYSRGHMAPAGDQTRDEERKRETFFLSNMAPQVQSHNSPTWSGLEDLARKWVADGKVDVEHVITGGFFYDPAEEDSRTADGEIEYKTIGPNHVAVPTHFYKIVLGRSNGQWRGVAFVIEHRAGIGTVRDFTTYVKPIDWIEERTGLDFFPQLSGPEQVRLEKSPGALW